MRIIDPHHHLWDLERHHYPWLAEAGQHIAGDYAAIRRSYRIEDFLADAAGCEPVKSVHVQAAFDPEDDPVKETAWLQSIADQPGSRGLPNGIVAFVDLGAPDAGDVLARHCAHANMRGIRQMLNHGPEPVLCFADRGDLMQDGRWRAGFALLERFDLSFDLQAWPWQLRDAAELAAGFPNTAIILNHTGMPIHRDPEAIELWRDGLRALAAQPNVAVKISGFGLLGRDWTTQSLRPYVLDTIAIFGVERAMFASNFPVDGLMSAYPAIWHRFDRITADFSEDERRKLFHDNAEATYRL